MFASNGHLWAEALACQDAVLRFTAHFDAQEYQAMERYFAPDGLWQRLEGDIQGVEGLRRHLAARSAGICVRHVISNMRTTFHANDHATVDSYLTAYRHDFEDGIALPAPMHTPLLLGRYVDEMRLHQDTWKIQRRRVHIDFRAVR